MDVSLLAVVIQHTTFTFFFSAHADVINVLGNLSLTTAETCLQSSSLTSVRGYRNVLLSSTIETHASSFDGLLCP